MLYSLLFVHIRWLLLGGLQMVKSELQQARQLTNSFTQFYTINIHIQLQHVNIVFVLTNIKVLG